MTTLRAALAAWDEAALATLANAGLVRRAGRDLADGKAVLVAETDDRASVDADGQRVELDAGGPMKATCACKALAPCRHRLLAVMFLRAAAPPATPDPAALLDALPLAAAERWAGRAGWRAAQEFAAADAKVEVEGGAIVVTFADEVPVRLLAGQGMDGIVSKAVAARRKPLHAAALLAARKHFGLSLPESVEVAIVVPDAPLPAPAFLAEVAEVLSEAASFTFNLAPAPLEERLFALSVSSRADALPRLGRLLRLLAAQVRLKRRRHFTFDPDLALDTLATAHALTRALGLVDAGTPAETREALYGTVRQEYRPAPPLALIGCGAERWRTAAGARGVTGVFYEPAADRWLTVAHARGAGQDPSFDPDAAFVYSALWGGGTLKQLASVAFVLDGAGVSADGRLSNPQGARVVATEAERVATDGWASRFDDWHALEARLADRFGFGLMRRNAPDFAVLAPHRLAAPFIDDLAQELVWPVADRSGTWLALTVAHGELPEATIGRIERLGREGWRGQVVVRVEPRGAGLALTPIAVEQHGRWASLSLAEPTRAETTRAWSDLWLRLDPRRRAQFSRAAGEATTAALGAAWLRLIDMAESGPTAARPATRDALARTAAQLDGFGLPSVAARLTDLAAAPTPALFLGAAYAVSLARGQQPALPRLRLG